MVRLAETEVRAAVCNPLFIKSFIGTLKYGASPEVMNSDCIRAILSIYKLLGMDTKQVVEVWHRLGVKDEAEGMALIERAKSTEGMTSQDSAESCLLAVKAFGDIDPAFNERAIKLLGGVVPA